MRIRSIKPEFWRSDDVSALPISARLLFIGLWSYVDDNGVGSDKLASIAADLFAPDLEVDPTETFRRVSVDTACLEERGLIVRYSANGKPLLYITNWEKHQLVKNPSKGKCFPLPSGEILKEAAPIRRHSVDTTETLGTGTGEQGNRGTEEQGKQTTSGELVRLPTPFEQVWDSWPKKTEKDRSQSEYAKHARDVPDLASLIATFGDAYARTTEKHYIPSLAAWLHRKRWTDELPQPRDGGSRVHQGLSVADELRRMEACHAGQ